jgi:DNA-binding CsgD family transcriptional regulator
VGVTAPIVPAAPAPAGPSTTPARRQLRLLTPATPLHRAPEPDPALLERAVELKTLDEAVRRVTEGEGSAIVIEAAAGLGKTALLDHAARAAARAGCIVRRATPTQTERDFSFGVLRALLEAPVRAAAGPRRAALLDGATRPAAMLLLGDARHEADPGIAMAHSALWLSAELAAGRGLVLIVDDAHHADARSLEILAYLARRSGDVPVLLMIATRPNATLIENQEPVTVLRPPPLTGGAPWLLAALAHQLKHDPACRTIAPVVQDAVRRRLSELTPTEREIATTAAVLGDGDALIHPLIAAAIREELTASDRARMRRLEPALTARRWSTALLHARARVLLAEGRFEDAYAAACEVGVRDERHGWRATAAVALAHLGRHEEAIALADEELASVRSANAPAAIAAALLARVVAEPDHAARAQRAAQALDELADRPVGLETVGLRLELGSALRRTGRRIEAREPLRTALAEADRAGAHALAGRARRELVATGLRPRRAALEGAGALTPRQRQICELAARGKGNRAIAAELFLSVKTVETHLAAAYGKLGVRTRSQLAGRI